MIHASQLGVFWGIFMLTMLLASGRGLRNGVDTLFSADSVNSVWIYGNRTVRAFEGLGAGRTIHLTVDDADALVSSVAELEHVSPRRGLAPSIMVTRGDVTSALPGVAIYPSYGVTEKVKMVRGRWLNDSDEQQARKVVVIGAAARKVLFSTQNPIGKYLVLGGVEFQVIGEYTDTVGPKSISLVSEELS